MRSLWDLPARDEVVARIGRLRPDSPRRWGRMTCPEMIVHVTDALAMYDGDLRIPLKRTPAMYPPLKQLFVYLVPMPKNVPTARELRARVPGAWDEEIARLQATLETFCAGRERTDRPPHPILGRLSCRAWGALAWKHTDHHLRQFGV